VNVAFAKIMLFQQPADECVLRMAQGYGVKSDPGFVPSG
jgi:hypothetical protein